MDHANNFHLADHLGAEEIHVYLHERGFADGRVRNVPSEFYSEVLEAWSAYVNPYRAFYAPYSLITAPFALLHRLSPGLARGLFSAIGAVPWPRPRDGSIAPEPLLEHDLEAIDVGGLEVQGWRLGDKVVLPTPGHSPCSVSLFWPEKKALLASDADYVGNPVFAACSLRDYLSSMKTMLGLAEAGQVDLLLPGHGLVTEGREQVLRRLRFQLRRLQVLRDEVRAVQRATGEKDVHKLTQVLVRKSPLFRMLKESNFPRMVLFGHNAVAVCLREDGVLP